MSLFYSHMAGADCAIAAGYLHIPLASTINLYGPKSWTLCEKLDPGGHSLVFCENFMSVSR